MIHLDEECLNKPVMLFNKDGEIFKMKSINSDVESRYFLIRTINKSCIELMCLHACYRCFEEYALSPTNQYIMIDKTVFCGYHLLSDSDICMKKCTHHTCCIHDRFSQRFTICSGNDEIIIWKSNNYNKQFGTLQLFMEEQRPIKVVVQHMDGHKTTYWHPHTIYLDQCRKITIHSKGIEKITGVFTINMNSIVSEFHNPDLAPPHYSM